MRSSLFIASIILLALSASYLGLLGIEGGSRLAFSLVIGASLGVAFQRGRFCFFCNLRDYIELRHSGGVVAILIALLAGTIGYAIVFGAWLPNPQAGRLAPDAHIGPVSLALVLAAAAFGAGMTMSGSCVSGHLYRLGEGSPTAPFALVGTILGFALGFQTWNILYLNSIAGSPVIWLPAWSGYPAWLWLQIGALAALIVFAIRASRTELPSPACAAPAGSPLTTTVQQVFRHRWPPLVTGLVVGAIAVASYFRVSPLGVTSELGSYARKLLAAGALLPDPLHGLDVVRGCRTAIAQTFLTENGVLITGMVAGSFASALIAGQFAPRWPTFQNGWRGIVGGVLLGWGAMTAVGCTVGTLLSGVMAGALSGWVFLAACAASVWITTAAGWAPSKASGHPTSRPRLGV